jgi:hypothetical protein
VMPLNGLPYRGPFPGPRPAELDQLPLPPNPMPSHHHGRPLKAWRYVGVYGPELMLCLAEVRIGRARQSFWALWDRPGDRLYQRTELGRGGVGLRRGAAEVRHGALRVDVQLAEEPGIEAVCPAGQSFAWTRKQAPVPARVWLEIDGSRKTLDSHAVIDDTAAYYPRHTHWRWSAGVGRSVEGQALAWNLVEGVNDPPADSERTVWVEGQPREVPPCHFADDLSAVDGLDFQAEAGIDRRQNLVVVRSRYRQPFGTFSGELPGAIRLAEGFGVMEEHDAWW